MIYCKDMNECDHQSTMSMIKQVNLCKYMNIIQRERERDK